MTSKPSEPDWEQLAELLADRVRRHFAAVLEARGYRADGALSRSKL